MWGVHPTTSEHAAFERFVADESAGLLRSAYLLTGERGAAEDLLQAALIRTLRRWRHIHGAPAAYTFTVLSNLARDRVRNELRRPRLAPDQELPDRPGPDAVDELLEREELVSAARALPRPEREVLACRFLLDLTVGETAGALKMPEGTVKSHTSRALARMRELLSTDARPIDEEVRHGQR
jgi:RNA polymerase sigma-70 factor (sigma-E family)